MKAIKFLFVVAIGASVVGCKTKGCTNIQAVNYNSEADSDDGSCNFIPIITLNGEENIELGLSDSYVDEGATAMNQDGSSVDVTDNAYIVSPGFAGEYEIVYTASNDYGTATTSRNVTIAMNQEDALADYTVDSDCGATVFPINGARTITAGGTSSALEIVDFFTLLGGTATATIDGQLVSFPNQTVAVTGGEIIFSGTGSFNNAATILTVDFDYENTIPFLGGSGSCVATFTKD